MSKLVISGGSGLLGTNWAINRRNVDSVHILLNSRLINISGVTSHQVNLQNKLDIRKLLKTLKPDFFIHAAGMTDINSCQKYPELSKISNINIAYNTAKICYELGISFIHISIKKNNVLLTKSIVQLEKIYFKISSFCKNTDCVTHSHIPTNITFYHLCYYVIKP